MPTIASTEHFMRMNSVALSLVASSMILASPVVVEFVSFIQVAIATDPSTLIQGSTLSERTVLERLRSDRVIDRLRTLRIIAASPQHHNTPLVAEEIIRAVRDESPAVRSAGADAFYAMGLPMHTVNDRIIAWAGSDSGELRTLALNIAIACEGDPEVLLQIASDDLKRKPRPAQSMIFNTMSYLKDSNYCNTEIVNMCYSVIGSKDFTNEEHGDALWALNNTAGLELLGALWYVRGDEVDDRYGHPFYTGDSLRFYEAPFEDGQACESTPAIVLLRKDMEARSGAPNIYEAHCRKALRVSSYLKGEQFRSVMPLAIKLLTNKSSSVRINAAEICIKGADDQVRSICLRVLNAGLRDRLLRNRIDAARAILKSHSTGVDAEAVLLTSLRSTDSSARLMALHAIGEVLEVIQSEKLLQGVTDLVREQPGEDWVKQKILILACTILGRTGPLAGSAAPSLLSLIEDRPKPSLSEISNISKDRVVFQAMIALQRIGETKSTLPAMRELIRRRQRDRRRGNFGFSVLAIQTIGQMGAAGKAAIPELISCLSDPNCAVRIVSANALAQLRSEATVAVPALNAAKSDALGRKYPRLRVALAMATMLIERKYDELADVEDVLVNAQHSYERADAAKSLGRLGPAAKRSLITLKQATVDVDSSVRAEARGAIERITR